MYVPPGQGNAPLVADLESWIRERRPKLSRGNDVAQAMEYMLKRWPAFNHFLDDGRICLSNNAVEGALRGIALGGKSWLFASSDRGGQRAAAMFRIMSRASRWTRQRSRRSPGGSSGSRSA